MTLEDVQISWYSPTPFTFHKRSCIETYHGKSSSIVIWNEFNVIFWEKNIGNMEIELAVARITLNRQLFEPFPFDLIFKMLVVVTITLEKIQYGISFGLCMF